MCFIQTFPVFFQIVILCLLGYNVSERNGLYGAITIIIIVFTLDVYSNNSRPCLRLPKTSRCFILSVTRLRELLVITTSQYHDITQHLVTMVTVSQRSSERSAGSIPVWGSEIVFLRYDLHERQHMVGCHQGLTCTL